MHVRFAPCLLNVDHLPIRAGFNVDVAAKIPIGRWSSGSLPSR
jgi:hypothetical protein